MPRLTKKSLEVCLLLVTTVAVVASGKGPDDGGDGGAGIENIPREGWTCGTVDDVCACTTLASATSHCPDWTEAWCCIMSPPATPGGSIACDCVSPSFLSFRSTNCSGFLAQSGEPTDEIVDICPLPPEDMP